MIPVYKIETYTGAVLDHSITSDAYSINIHERLTDAIGQFTVLLPSNSQFEDIALHDLVKIYLGYDSVPATPNFVGRVLRIEDGFTKQSGYLRNISGLALGEILLRRIKCGHYSGTPASDIVKEFATDLSLGNSDVATETATPPLEFVNETYFDAMKTLSDVWINAGTQLKKEFYVTPSSNLLYKNRPLRTSGTETLGIGVNIKDYVVRRSLENLRNSITVYGAWDEYFVSKIPTDENWTEDTPYWTALAGSLSKDTADKTTGTASIKCASGNVDFYRILKPEFAFVSGNARTITQSFSRLHFMGKELTNVYLWAPDSSNCFSRAISLLDYWDTYNFTLPTADNLNGWTKVGNGQSDFIVAIEFKGSSVDPVYTHVDDLAFQGGRFSYKTSDLTSISNYGQRDLVVIADTLKSNSQCEARAKTLLYQRKEPITEIDISVLGNTNILVGDRLALNLPRASVNGNFDVTVVDHTITDAGFLTKFTATEGLDNRYSLSVSPIQEVSRLKTAIRGMSRDFKVILS